MSIIRGRLSGDGFTAVPNHWLRDSALSYKGKGLLAAIASHRDDYELTIEQLIAESKDGKDSVSTALKELERVGYLRRLERRRKPDGTLGAYDYELVEFPHGTPGQPNVSAGQDQRGKSDVVPVRKTRAGRGQGKQGVSAGRNQCGFTTVVNPHTKKTTGLEDQEKTTSSSRTRASGTAQRGDGQEEEEEPVRPQPESQPTTTRRAPRPSAEARELVAAVAWPLGKPQPATVDRARLAAGVDRCLAAGHSPDAVLRDLVAAVAGVDRPVGSALSRLRDLADLTPEPAHTAASTPAPALSTKDRCPANPLLARGRCGCHDDPADTTGLRSPDGDVPGSSRDAAGLEPVPA